MRLGTKLILCLVITLIATMLELLFLHELNIRRDNENILREMRVEMISLARSLQAALGYMYGEERGVNTTQNFIDGVAQSGNIHGVVVYDSSAEPVAISASLTDTKPYPHLDPRPILAIDPRPVLAKGAAIDGYLDHPTHPIYYRIKPIFDGDKQIVGAFVLGRRGTGYDTLGPHDGVMLTIALVDGLVTVVILLIVRRNVSRPIKQLIERIRAIGEGRWEKRIPIKGKNEISSLALEFNQMCERLEELYGKLTREQQERLALERSLRQSDKLASIGQLAAGLAHEIGTPLNIIGGRAEFLLSRSRSHAEISDNLQIVRSQIDRIAGIVRQLLEFSRRGERVFRKIELAVLVEKVIGLLEHKIREKKCKRSGPGR